jgi:hypothetical protein
VSVAWWWVADGVFDALGESVDDAGAGLDDVEAVVVCCSRR